MFQKTPKMMAENHFPDIIPELVSAMEQFIIQPELIQQVGKASQQIAVEKYDVHKGNVVILKRMDLI